MTTTGGDGAVRKAIHIALSLGAAAVVGALEPTLAAVVLASATLVALVVELGRRASPGFADGFRRRLGGMLKEREKTRMTGATTLAVGFTIAAVLFPGQAPGAILVAGLGDPAAAVVGARLGRVRYPGGKSVAGSVAFLAVAAGIALALGLGPGAALLVAGMLTIAEAVSLPIDDNLYLPLAAAAAIALAGGMAGS